MQKGKIKGQDTQGEDVRESSDRVQFAITLYKYEKRISNQDII